MTRIFLLLILPACLLSCDGSAPDTTGTAVGEAAPSIATKDVNGAEFQLASLAGDYVIIEFYASWCGPCHSELAKLKNLYRKEQANGTKLSVVSIALEKDAAIGKKFLEQTKFPWENQIINEARYVRFDPLASAYSVTEIPSSFLLNPEGNIMAAHSTMDEIAEILAGAEL